MIHLWKKNSKSIGQKVANFIQDKTASIKYWDYSPTLYTLPTNKSIPFCGFIQQTKKVTPLTCLSRSLVQKAWPSSALNHPPTQAETEFQRDSSIILTMSKKRKCFWQNNPSSKSMSLLRNRWLVEKSDWVKLAIPVLQAEYLRLFQALPNNCTSGEPWYSSTAGMPQ